MNIYIFLRATENWDTVSLKECHFSNSTSNSNQNYRALLAEWNLRFSMTWQMFRHELKKKASESYGLTPVLTTEEEVLSKNDEDVVIPIDDDDWLHEDIESFIQSEMKDHDILQWTQIINTYEPRHKVDKWGVTKYHRTVGTCTSDSCIRVGVLRKVDNLTTTLLSHSYAGRTLMYNRRMYVPEMMSCYNRHIGSHSYLYHKKSLDQVIQAVVDIEVPDWASHFEEQINWLQKLTKDVVEGKRIKCL